MLHCVAQQISGSREVAWDLEIVTKQKAPGATFPQLPSQGF